MSLPFTIALRSFGAIVFTYGKDSWLYPYCNFTYVGRLTAVIYSMYADFRKLWSSEDRSSQYRTCFCILSCSSLPAPAGMPTRLLHLGRDSPLIILISSFILFIFSTRSLIRLDRSPVIKCCSLLSICASALVFCAEIFSRLICISVKVLLYYYSEVK